MAQSFRVHDIFCTVRHAPPGYDPEGSQSHPRAPKPALGPIGPEHPLCFRPPARARRIAYEKRPVSFRLRLQLSLIAMLLIPMVSWADSPPVSDWKAFSPPDQSFRVNLPGEPKKTERSRWLPIGTVESTVYKVELPVNTFGLSMTDLPRLTFAFRSRDKIVETTADGFVEDAGATETGSSVQKLGGLKAKEVSYTIPASEKRPELRGVSRMLIDDKRLYIFYAEVEKTFPQEEIEAYFESVQFKPGKD